jgi:mRNA interferase RelE/StbE
VASYRLLVKASAARELEALPRRDRIRVVGRIARLADDPRPAGCEKLSGHEQYRVRQGDYRILYEVSDAEVVVIVIKVGHRRDVYR